MTYILIFTILIRGYQPTMDSAEFNTEAACLSAGRVMATNIQKLEGNQEVVYGCFAKGPK